MYVFPYLNSVTIRMILHLNMERVCMYVFPYLNSVTIRMILHLNMERVCMYVCMYVFPYLNSVTIGMSQAPKAIYLHRITKIEKYLFISI